MSSARRGNGPLATGTSLGRFIGSGGLTGGFVSTGGLVIGSGRLGVIGSGLVGLAGVISAGAGFFSPSGGFTCTGVSDLVGSTFLGSGPDVTATCCSSSSFFLFSVTWSIKP